MQLQKAHNIIHSDSRLAYYQLRQLRTIARSLSDDAAKMLVQAFISCRLLYCSSVRHLRQFGPAPAVGTKCGSSAGHWSRSTRAHHAGAEAASLAACEATNWLLKSRCWCTSRSTTSHRRPIWRVPTCHGRRTSAPPISWCTVRLGALWLLCFNGAKYKHSYLHCIVWRETRHSFTYLALMPPPGGKPSMSSVASICMIYWSKPVSCGIPSIMSANKKYNNYTSQEFNKSDNK